MQKKDNAPNNQLKKNRKMEDKKKGSEGGVRHAPPSLARVEDGGARGNAILAVLILEAVVVVTLDVLEKIRALQRRHRAVDLIVGPDERRHDNVARGEGHGGWWSGRACRLPPS